MDLSMTSKKAASDSASPGRARQRRAPKGEKRREELLNAALAMFSVEGYSGASIAKIAEHVGITVAGVLHHFPSKIALLMAVLKQRDEVSLRMAEEIHSDGSLDGFFSTLKAINQANVRIPGVVRAFSILNAESLVQGHPAWEWYQSRYQAIHAHMRKDLQALVGTGEVRDDVDLDMTIRHILAMMDGLQLQWLRFSDRVDLEKCFEAYLAQVEQAIKRMS
jgi:AcrR family transcriptional regulator